MFPKPVQKAFGAVGSTTGYVVSNSMSWAKKGAWYGSSTMFLLMVPFQLLSQLDMMAEMNEKALAGMGTQANLLMAGPSAI